MGGCPKSAELTRSEECRAYPSQADQLFIAGCLYLEGVARWLPVIFVMNAAYLY